ncbi:hypothetical protein EXE44_03020 [Halorubrum sp. SS7]|uniref:hypothetical protein n=1 Tax=Halorubrum sp. SS7 TaxID=2518119 RepID=UPI0010F6ACB4|nr:hypothetical protein [Halorubrum sp. SS7]TKX59425.1 hypothetical protein EXE44_03020 [Halorubrum sp. SS7]
MSGSSEGSSSASGDADAADAGSADAGGTDTADTMRERAGENRVKLWLLLRADRLVVAAVLTLAVFVAFVAAAVAISPSLATKVGSSDPVETLFASMITAIVTGATLVVTIGQLVLTQENGPLGDQRDRMDDTLAVRDDIADLTGGPTPTDPAAFLDAILGAAAEHARDLRDSVEGQGDDGDGSSRDALRAEVDDLATGLTGNADAVRGQLDGAEFGSFDVVFAALNFDYGPKIGQIERIATEHDDALTDDERGLLDELKATVSLFGPAREHVKTLYFQWALIDLSRLILYAAVPALVVAGLMVTVVDAGTFPGSTLGVAHVTLAVGGAFAVALLPFSLFVSYLLRVLTLAKRTLAIGPLVLRDSE